MAQYEKWLKAVDSWAAKYGASLERGPPLTKSAIAALPKALLGYRWALPTPYVVGEFTIPPSYGELLRLHGSLVLRDESGSVFKPFELWEPSVDSLTRSWCPEGTTVDDRAITTTRLISFASAGFNVEASRWCFLTGRRSRSGELPILVEDNDYECLTGYYVDDGSPLSDLMATPPFTSFEKWFKRLVDVLVSRPFDPDSPDVVVNDVLTAHSDRS